MLSYNMTPFTHATFDCYGTLIDWEGGVGSFLYDLALRNDDPGPPPGRKLRERWEAIQFEVIGGDYRPYKEVLAESLRLFAEERGYRLDAGDADAFVRAMRSWQPFTDTTPALRLVQQAGIKLVPISNTDHDILDHSERHMGLQFDNRVTAQDCRAYKPSDTVFQQALERIGVEPERILHVAFGFKYDIGPAKRAGMRTAWINRHVEPLPSSTDAPDYEWRDLWGLAELVAPVAPIAASAA
jgi:2-haloalkanoic acid dehalogenase type II